MFEFIGFLLALLGLHILSKIYLKLDMLNDLKSLLAVRSNQFPLFSQDDIAQQTFKVFLARKNYMNLGPCHDDYILKKTISEEEKQSEIRQWLAKKITLEQQEHFLDLMVEANLMPMENGRLDVKKKTELSSQIDAFDCVLVDLVKKDFAEWKDDMETENSWERADKRRRRELEKSWEKIVADGKKQKKKPAIDE